MNNVIFHKFVQPIVCTFVERYDEKLFKFSQI